MAQTRTISPFHPFVVISDASRGILAEFVEGKLVLSTDTAVSVACRANVEGETTISLGSATEVSPLEELVFDGILKTPTKWLVVSTVEDDEVLGADSTSLETRVRIWTNSLSFPDEIVIGWGD